MKVSIPLAGKGTRLRPHTHITPAPMLEVAHERRVFQSGVPNSPPRVDVHPPTAA